MINWIKIKLNKFKKWIIALIFGTAVLAAGLDIVIETPTELINTELTNITAIQSLAKIKKGKYQFYPYRIINGIGYEIHEYENPKGEVGYTVFITEQRDDGIYKKAISNGVEGLDRSFDWIKILNTATTTLETATTTL